MANKLRDLVAPGKLASVMSAHNPLSARLAELAGFDGIWASGFELSAAYGVPDASLLSFTQHLEMTRAIVEQVAAPVVADLDTGYGNAINVMHVVGAYARAGVAAVVIEDKTFPKDTSLLAGARQDLVRVEEFQGKIAAARAASGEHDLMVIARTEALIADLGIEEASRRAHAYAKIRELGKIGMVIYGNHAIRAAVTAMRQIFAEIRADGGIHNIDKRIVSVEEIFDLQRVADMKRLEEKYLR
jgi:phosphoenolpyruvate phosphomutase